LDFYCVKKKTKIQNIDKEIEGLTSFLITVYHKV